MSNYLNQLDAKRVIFYAFIARPIFYDSVILEPEDELRLDGSRVEDAVEDEGCPGFDNQ